MSVDSMYQEIILDHYKNPHHKGLREPFEAEVHHVNPTCGDEVTLRVQLQGEGTDAVIEDVSYDALGCSISQASTSRASRFASVTTARGRRACATASPPRLARPCTSTAPPTTSTGWRKASST